MAAANMTDFAKPVAADLLRHAARSYPDLDDSTMRRAFLLAAVELGERIREAARRRDWEDTLLRSASANPWQVEDD